MLGRILAVTVLLLAACSGDDGQGDTSTGASAGTSGTGSSSSSAGSTGSTGTSSTTNASDSGPGTSGSPTTSGSSTTDGSGSSGGSSSSTTDSGGSTSGGATCEPKNDDIPCVTCVKGACCNEWTACMNDATCTCIIECHLLGGKSLGNCKSQCGDDGGLYQTTYFCGQQSCLNTCDWDCC